MSIFLSSQPMVPLGHQHPRPHLHSTRQVRSPIPSLPPFHPSPVRSSSPPLSHPWTLVTDTTTSLMSVDSVVDGRWRGVTWQSVLRSRGIARHRRKHDARAESTRTDHSVPGPSYVFVSGAPAQDGGYRHTRGLRCEHMGRKRRERWCGRGGRDSVCACG